MIVAVPVNIPVTMPEVEPIVATAGLLLVQVPPNTASLNTVVCPTHTPVLPMIGVGTGVTVIVLVAAHPVRLSV